MEATPEDQPPCCDIENLESETVETSAEPVTEPSTDTENVSQVQDMRQEPDSVSEDTPPAEVATVKFSHNGIPNALH